MIWRDYQLEEVVVKARDDATLWQTERGLVKISRNTLVLPVKIDDERRGYVFHGNGKLILDTIVETDEGAVGRPVDNELNTPFLMLSANEELRQCFAPVGEEDLKSAGYGDCQQFITEARTLCERFFSRGAHVGHGRFSGDKAFLFAFDNGTPKLDILVARDSELVYKKPGLVFVSNKRNSILKGNGVVIVSHSGRSLVVNR